MHFATRPRTWLFARLCSEIALSRKPFRIRHMYIYNFLLWMADTVTSQNIDLSFWNILYIHSFSWSIVYFELFWNKPHKSFSRICYKLTLPPLRTAGPLLKASPNPVKPCPIAHFASKYDADSNGKAFACMFAHCGLYDPFAVGSPANMIAFREVRSCVLNGKCRGRAQLGSLRLHLTAFHPTARIVRFPRRVLPSVEIPVRGLQD
jgi:hypothetical protein